MEVTYRPTANAGGVLEQTRADTDDSRFLEFLKWMPLYFLIESVQELGTAPRSVHWLTEDMKAFRKAPTEEWTREGVGALQRLGLIEEVKDDIIPAG